VDLVILERKITTYIGSDCRNMIGLIAAGLKRMWSIVPGHFCSSCRADIVETGFFFSRSPSNHTTAAGRCPTRHRRISAEVRIPQLAPTRT